MAEGTVWIKDAPELYYKQFWAPLKYKLNQNLQNDISRVYNDTLYCDWIIKFDDKTLKLNRCILIARAYRFYNLLINLVREGGNINKLQIDCICRFVQKIYHNNNIENDETAVIVEVQSLRSSLCPSPDSENFVTPDSSPSSACHKNEFFDAVGEDFDQELQEQDHLSDLFTAISFRTAQKFERRIRNVKLIRNEITAKSKSAHLSDMDSGLETASSENSGMEFSDNYQLSNKESRLVDEQDASSSSDDTTDEFDDLGANTKNQLIASQTKEQKQKQNEEIVIMESSSVSSETGSWESVFPRPPPQPSECTPPPKTNGQNHFFIDASSLLDENEVVGGGGGAAMDLGKGNSKLTKVKVNEVPDGQKFEVAEFQKEIRVYEQPLAAGKTDFTTWLSTDSASTSTASPNNHEGQSHIIEGKTDFNSWFTKESNSASSTASPVIVNVVNTTQFNPWLFNESSSPVRTIDNGAQVDSTITGPIMTSTAVQVEPNAWLEPLQTELKSYSLESLTKIKRLDETSQTSNSLPTTSGFSAICLHVEPKSDDSGVDLDKGKIEDDKPSFVRSNTFELKDEDHMLILRENERRQGSLLFANVLEPTTPHNSIIQTVETDSDSEAIEPNGGIPCQMKRDESIPIISGGVSSDDFKPEVKESPIPRRKLESTPIVSGGAVLDPGTIESKPIITSSWVVDMKHQPKPKPIESPKSTHKSSLGFYIDLKQFPDNNPEPKPKKIEPKIDLKDAEKTNMFSMFIDFNQPKKKIPNRLSQSLYSKKEKLTTKPDMSQSMTQKSADEPEQNVSTVSVEPVQNPSVVPPPPVVPEQLPIETTTVVENNSNPVEPVKSSDDKSGVFMFIDSDVTVVKRRRSSASTSGKIKTQNRHSWNSSGDSDTSTLCHQRTYSLSGEGTGDFPNRPIIESKSQRFDTSSSSDENKDTSSLTENEDKSHGELKPAETKMEVIAEVKETSSSGFVRLSDLDKPVPKIITPEVEPKITSRMTRSIPETSWIESKLMMTRSTGSRSASSRLFPHLSTSTPSMFQTQRVKSPLDTDEMVSELSDLSSMHSSTALEVSTEETSHSSSYQPQHAADRLGHDLLRMFLEEISPDVTVEVGGRRLKAHKCILSSRCQYFAAMLSGGWVESAGNVISLQGFSYNAVHFAMCHIYSGAADIPETISLVELATLADMLGLEGLKEVVAYTLKLKHCHLFHKPCSVCVVGVLECLPLAAAYGLDELYRKALRWITRYFVRVWPTRSFAMLPKELMEKCYQQHVVHMSADNVLETTLCCDKLLATLPTVRWAEIVHELTSQLADACQHYVTHHFSSVLASASFLSLGKELSWNISRLEDGLMKAAERLPPEQACRSYGRAHRLLALLDSGDDSWSINFIDLVRKLLARVEDCVVRQAVRVSNTPTWTRLDPTLRARVQELSCLPLLDRPRISRQPRSTSGSRNLDLRQVRLAMIQQQHTTRRTHSTDSRPKPKPAVIPTKIEPPRPRSLPTQKTKLISSSESSRTSSPAFKRVVRKEPVKIIQKKPDDQMSVDSLASPVHKKIPPARNTSGKTVTKVKNVVEPKKPVQLKPKQSNILKTNVQKTDKSISKSLPTMNKENRTVKQPQSKSGSSSSTQHNTSSPQQARTTMSPYTGSPSLRRSLLLAARAPQTPVKPVSPATNKRLARVAASHSVTSPTKASAAKCVQAVQTKQKTMAKTNKVVSKTVKKSEKIERSGTFLKDEPEVLTKTDTSEC